MLESQPICLLDYLAGTLATAYRGMVTSLVIKDCCITTHEEGHLVTGKLLALPEGKYSIWLMSGGTELARAELAPDGAFRLTVPAGAMKEGRGLQLDLVQQGRHIGSFLLKRSPGGVTHFASALELAEELGGINFKLLDGMLSGRPGLQGRAQKVIADVFSSKKDWQALSNDINTFMRDLYWAGAGAFDAWFPVLARYSLRAASSAPGPKTAANALDLLALPLENMEDTLRLAGLCRAWLGEIKEADLTPRFGQALRVADAISRQVPGVDAAPLVGPLLESLGALVPTTVSDAVVNAVEDEAAAGGELRPFSEHAHGETRKRIRAARTALLAGDTAQALAVMHEIDMSIYDGTAVATALFETVETHLPGLRPGTVARVLGEAFSVAYGLPEDKKRSVMDEAMRLLRQALAEGHAEAAVRLVQAMGQGGGRDTLLSGELARTVVDGGEQKLLVAYRDALSWVLVPAPAIQGLSEETWAEQANPLHLARLGGLMDVLSAAGDAPFAPDVLVRLVANLAVSGVFIPDEALFQRRISALLNSPVPRREFLCAMLLLARLPVFFNDVGASGRVREFTTDIDAWGNDPVIYFLRKQVHVNASSNNIPLVEAVIRSWAQADAEPLKGLVPQSIIDELDPALLPRYAKVIAPLLKDMDALDDDGTFHPKHLVRLGREGFAKRLEHLDTADEVQAKVRLLLLVYMEIVGKYAMTPEDDDEPAGIGGLVRELAVLKEKICAPERTEPVESLYFKRHIAFGIPSVIGTYHEEKFDAAGRAMRLLEEARLVLEKEAARLESGEDNAADISRMASFLGDIYGLFRFYGMTNPRVDEVLGLLHGGGLYLSQAVDLLRVWQHELTWHVEWFYRTFHGPLIGVLKRFPADELPANIARLGEGAGRFEDRAADSLMRKIISSMAGLDELDRLLNALILNLNVHMKKQGDFRVGEAQATGQPFYTIHTTSAVDAQRLAGLLGGKAANLMVLAEAGVEIPPGAAFPSHGMKDFDAAVDGPGFARSLEEAVAYIEGITGEAFGDADNPLFLSVRSGSYVSMPGILETVLYVGMNEQTRSGLALQTKSEWVALDAHRRFIEHYAVAVLGVDPDALEKPAEKFLKKHKARHPRDLGAAQVKKLLDEYRAILEKKGLTIPDDPMDQLREAVRAVYRSWHSVRAGEFRRGMGVSAHWGTAVVVMEMIRANAPGSGASVFFTRDPMTLEPMAWGESRRMSTGDDLVGGRAYSRPLAKTQTEEWEALEERGPDLYRRHAELARRVEEVMGLPQEIEAAYVGQKMYVLQTKRMEFRRGRAERFDAVCKMESATIGRGIGVYGGAMSGAATFAQTVEEVRALREKLDDMPIILVRHETSTDDVALMSEIDGLLTAVGGASSHAAILAQKFGLTAVVGSPDVVVGRAVDGSVQAEIGTYIVAEGMPVSIDGSTGVIYSGVCGFVVKERWY